MRKKNIKKNTADAFQRVVKTVACVERALIVVN